MAQIVRNVATEALFLTSQHELAIWQPAWPTKRVKSQHCCCYGAWWQQGAAAVKRVRHKVTILTVQTDDFTHVD